MSMKVITILSASALALVACNKKQETTDATVTNTAVVDATTVNATVPAASPAQMFANAVAASDAYEIGTSKLALDKSSSPRSRNTPRR